MKTNIQRAASTPGPAVTEAVFHSFLRLWGQLRQVQDPYFAQFGISASQWGILRVLQRAELNDEHELPLKEVSARLLVQPPSVTGVVDRMERQGLVKRNASRTDLRVRHLSLTPNGRNLLAKVLEGHAERIRRLFAGIQLHEQETMLSLLQRMQAHLQTLTPPQPEDSMIKLKAKRK